MATAGYAPTPFIPTLKKVKSTENPSKNKFKKGNAERGQGPNPKQPECKKNEVTYCAGLSLAKSSVAQCA